MHKIIALLLMLVTSLSSTGCNYVFGDSRSAQLIAGGFTADDGHTWYAEAGASLERWSADVQEQAAKKPPKITLALVLNDAATWKPDYAWTAHDEAVWSWTIASIYLVTCLQIVLTEVPESADAAFPGLRQEVAKANAFITSLTTARIDKFVWWRPTANELTDGVHLGTEDAARRFHDLLTGDC